MKRRGWLHLLGLAPVAAALARLPGAPSSVALPEPPKIDLPPPVEVPGYRDLHGLARRFEVRQDWIDVGDGSVPGLRETILDARLFGVDPDWQDLLGEVVPVRFSFPKRSDVYLWEGYLTDLRHNIGPGDAVTTEIVFRGTELPLILHPRT